MKNNLNRIPWMSTHRRNKIKKLKSKVKDRNEEYVLLNTVKNLDLYLHPIELKLRERYLQIVQKHGNGLWALEELVWEVYDKHIDDYEALNEDDKFILNMYMRTLRSLYK